MSARLAAILREHPVVVTGMGTFGAAGSNVPEVWEKVIAGTSSAGWMEVRCGGTSERVAACRAAQIADDGKLSRRVRRMDRSVQMAHLAAIEAWQDAGLDPDSGPGTGVFVGTSRGPLQITLESSRRLALGPIAPHVATNSTVASLSGALSAHFGATGPCLTFSAACASSAAAIALGAEQIALGTAERMLVGGAEAPLQDLVLAQLRSVGVLGRHEDPRRACRPFDVTRNGTVLGEGAAFLVLESLEAAQRRGARIHAKLAGWAIGSAGAGRAGFEDSGESVIKLMRQALTLAELEPGQIDYINAHGTGTRMNDTVESRAIASVWGSSPVAVSSTKSVTGHCMGATSAIEAVVTLLALIHGKIPVSGNCSDLDPDCTVDLVREPRTQPVRAAVSNSSGFWGNGGVLVFSATDR